MQFLNSSYIRLCSVTHFQMDPRSVTHQGEKMTGWDRQNKPGDGKVSHMLTEKVGMKLRREVFKRYILTLEMINREALWREKDWN